MICIDRPIEESIESIVRRCPDHDADQLRAHQEWLQKGKQDILAKVKSSLVVQYHELLTDGRREIDRILDFLKLNHVTSEQIQRALNFIDPSQCHSHREAVCA